MAKASPARYSFNAGEFSPFVEGRTDIDRYGASMRLMSNAIAAPQGPAIRRSGSYFAAEAYANDKYSALIPFVFSDEQALMVEAAHECFRFVLDEGIQVYTQRVITAITHTTPMRFDSATLDALIGDQIVLSGFPGTDNVNGRQLTITGKTGNNYTVNYNYPGSTGTPAGRYASLIYSIDSPYDHAEVRNIRSVQSLDVLYLFCDGYKPRKLSRYASYDWRLSVLDFQNGPYMPEDTLLGTLVLGGSGSPVSGGTASASSGTAADAFDGNPATHWACASNQAGWIQYQFASGKVINGYTIYVARTNDDTTYTSIDYAPGDWDFLGSNNGTTWFLLDSQRGYVLYDNNRSVFFQAKNTVSYTYYRLHVYACTRNGPISPRIADLIMSDAATTDITCTLSGSYTNFNRGSGFLATDVGRLLRLKGSDQFWRTLRVKTRSSSTSVTLTLLDEPFPAAETVLNWQPGYWSDTTGWPTCGTFFDDKLWLGGSLDAPDLIAGSVTGAYEDFRQRTPVNEVLDDSAVVIRLNSRRMSSIRWLSNDERGLLVGTGANEAVVSQSSTETALSARNIKARSSTERGSANIEPVKVDRQVLYVQGSRRTVREYAYVFEADGYKSPSMSLFASHLGVPRFAQMAYASEPHSIVWFRKDDGTVAGLTYNREENVIGWHRHNFADGFVESIGCIPSSLDVQDTLWLIVKRNLGTAGSPQYVRYIERLTRFWDFDSVVEQAHFVDCGLKYEGAATDEVFGCWHLEGQQVQGLRDGIPFEAVIENGKLTLTDEAEVIVFGLGYVSECEISRIEAGAADGTAQGKQKRINNCTIQLWQSAYGELGKYNEDTKEFEYQDIEYEEPYDELEPIKLQDGMLGPMVLPRGYGKRGSIAFRQTKPLPFNVISLLPQMHTYDR